MPAQNHTRRPNICTDSANNIINIGLNCKNHGINKVFISSSFVKKTIVKKTPKLNRIIRRVNDQLRELCEINGFLFINNDMIATDNPTDIIHLQDIVTNILTKNFYQVFNNFLFEDHSWLENLYQANEFVFESDLRGLSKLRKAYPNNPI